MDNRMHNMIMKWSNLQNVPKNVNTPWNIEDNHTCIFMIKLLRLTKKFQ